MATSFTHRYIPRIEQTEENLFVEEYYSSTDTKIYIDDEKQTEIAYINYSLQEQLKPLYGYSSRTFDDIAIGSRIVTGTFKVPIKNPEAQTKMDEIKSGGNTNTNQDYNDRQNDLVNGIEHITHTAGNSDSSTEKEYVESDEEFQYMSKLIALGYDLDYNSNKSTLKFQIKKFQKAHNLQTTGTFDDATKDGIDRVVGTSRQLETRRVPAGTVLYLGPATTFDKVTTLKSAEDVYIIDDDYDDWTYVMLKDGTEGYIQK